jgi:uncharacterized protein DUF6702
MVSGLLAVPVAIAAAPQRGGHPLHTTLTTIEWRAETRALHVAVRVFTQDLKLAETATRSGSACGYARSALVLRDATGHILDVQRCTTEEQSDVTWIRLEVPLRAPPGVHVLNAFLFESFSDEVNVVQSNLLGQAHTVLFTSGDAPKAIGG